MGRWDQTCPRRISNTVGKMRLARSQASTQEGAESVKFYIASHSQEGACKLMHAVQSYGHEVTARWILSDKKFCQGLDAYSDEERTKIATMDEEDIFAATDGLILLAEEPGKLVPGGKHVETGIAIALGRPVFVIGRRENIFHWHPRVHLFDDQGAFMRAVCGCRSSFLTN